MKLFERLQRWWTWRRAARNVKYDAQVLLSDIAALQVRTLEYRNSFRSSFEDASSEIEKVLAEIITLEGQIKELNRQQERLELENEGLRDRQKYIEELLLPAMTQGHSRIIEMLEAETAIQIRRQVAAKGSVE